MLSFVFAMALSPLAAPAQLQNPGFEATRAGGGPAKWGQVVVSPFPCAASAGYDSTYFQTKDAHSGSFALELGNAFCDNTFYSGKVHAMDNDAAYFDAGFPYTQSPPAISFYYKFFPVGGDRATVTVELTDDVNGAGIFAEGKVSISQAVATYTAISVPLVYQAAAVPTRINIDIRIDNPSGTVHYGTRFLVDDFSDQTTGVEELTKHKDAALLYPSPAQDFIKIKSDRMRPMQLVLYNALGQQVLCTETLAHTATDIRVLAAGTYFYHILDKGEVLGKGVIRVSR